MQSLPAGFAIVKVSCRELGRGSVMSGGQFGVTVRVPGSQFSDEAARDGAAAATETAGTAQAAPLATERRDGPAVVKSWVMVAFFLRTGAGEARNARAASGYGWGATNGQLPVEPPE